jgi:hypothetical protein
LINLGVIFSMPIAGFLLQLGVVFFQFCVHKIAFFKQWMVAEVSIAWLMLRLSVCDKGVKVCDKGVKVCDKGVCDKGVKSLSSLIR